jgi:sigma-E factor negative regulatory protein RseC
MRSVELLEQLAKVIEVDARQAWVETEARSHCSHCASHSCGTSVVARLFGIQRNRFVVENTIQVRVGDQVIIGIPSSLIAQASVLAYFVPLVFMLSLTLLGQVMGLNDGLQALGALLGLLLGFTLVRRLTREGVTRRTAGPRLLRVVKADLHIVEFPKLN